MSNQKFNPPSSPPPPAYGSDGTGLNTPQPAHVPPQPLESDYYGASPAARDNTYPPQNYPPQGGPNGGYYPPGPQMYQQPQGGYYGPQQGYGPPQPGPGYYPQQGPYGPQGGYYDNRRGGGGFFEAMLASLACCCCLDACLLF